MSTVKKYSVEYKKEAIKLAKEIGIGKAGLELGVSKSTVNRCGLSTQFSTKNIQPVKKYIHRE